MTEQELLDMFIQEHINMLIDIFHKNQPEKFKKEEERILHAEIFIESLPCKEKELVENYSRFFHKPNCFRRNFSI